MLKTMIVAVLLAGTAAAQTPTMQNDIVPAYDVARPQADYVRREVMIPMRDGTKLFTVIVMKKGTRGGPMLLTRTPYDAGKATARNRSQKITEILPISDAEFVNENYIRVYQDVRGLHGSEGDYVMNRPLRGPLNATANDHATDAYDTIDWLVKNVPESNGRVGITGSSYPGFTALMALIDPHPALKASVPQSPMVDGWMGDDWFHNGAFRQPAFDYIISQTARKGGGDVPYGSGDDYTAYLEAGSAGDFARLYGADAFPAARKIMEHPAYDAWWQGQAVDKLLAGRPLTVPTMLVVGQWDQEDSYGAPAVYKALEPKDIRNDMVSLVIGPWRHSGVNYDGSSLGKLDFDGDTGLQFRAGVMKPFLDQHLKTGAPKATTPPVLTYATGVNKWQPAKAWPMGKATPLYLRENQGLSFTPSGKAGADTYVSDPAKPVPFVPRPVHLRDGDVWKPWLVADQTFVSDRTDVLSFTSAPLDKPLHIAGAPLVDLFAATSGSDSDWVVKLIDVFPDEATGKPRTAGMQLPIGIEIYRGRYVRQGFATPAALTPGKIENYKFELPHVNHVLAPGHRLMVQVQSSLFPLYDRNPQTFVPNIFDAKAADYQPATQSIAHGPGQASAVWLPIVP